MAEGGAALNYTSCTRAALGLHYGFTRAALRVALGLLH